jgi:hypothetical protein
MRGGLPRVTAAVAVQYRIPHRIPQRFGIPPPQEMITPAHRAAILARLQGCQMATAPSFPSGDIYAYVRLGKVWFGQVMSQAQTTTEPFVLSGF